MQDNENKNIPPQGDNSPDPILNERNDGPPENSEKLCANISATASRRERSKGGTRRGWTKVIEIIALSSLALLMLFAYLISSFGGNDSGGDNSDNAINAYADEYAAQPLATTDSEQQVTTVTLSGTWLFDKQLLELSYISGGILSSIDEKFEFTSNGVSFSGIKLISPGTPGSMSYYYPDETTFFVSYLTSSYSSGSSTFATEKQPYREITIPDGTTVSQNFSIWLQASATQISFDYEDVKQIGYEQGYNEGYTAGEEAGYNAGKTDGYDEGYEAGYNAGKTDGYNDGYAAGYAAGISSSDQVTENAYNSGYAAGKTDGYDEGYEQGYSEGVFAAENGTVNPIIVFLEPVHQFLNVKLFGEFSLGLALEIVLFVAIALIFIRLFAGGK